MSYEKISGSIEYVLGVLANSGSLETDWHNVATKFSLSNANKRFVVCHNVKTHSPFTFAPFVCTENYLST